MDNRKNKIDTPRANAWHTQVNQPNFVPAQAKSQSVRLKTISVEEGRELSAILHGRG